mmetsp:Transcript_15041/g.50756  ORF Transcript_15041/g.50756 Transcript_15041/m.50756 type:complete len:227 (-) Transcript_15041:192-872(-)
MDGCQPAVSWGSEVGARWGCTPRRGPGVCSVRAARRAPARLGHLAGRVGAEGLGGGLPRVLEAHRAWRRGAGRARVGAAARGHRGPRPRARGRRVARRGAVGGHEEVPGLAVEGLGLGRLWRPAHGGHVALDVHAPAAGHAGWVVLLLRGESVKLVLVRPAPGGHGAREEDSVRGHGALDVLAHAVDGDEVHHRVVVRRVGLVVGRAAPRGERDEMCGAPREEGGR